MGVLSALNCRGHENGKDLKTLPGGCKLVQMQQKSKKNAKEDKGEESKG